MTQVVFYTNGVTVDLASVVAISPIHTGLCQVAFKGGAVIKIELTATTLQKRLETYLMTLPDVQAMGPENGAKADE